MTQSAQFEGSETYKLTPNRTNGKPGLADELGVIQHIGARAEPHAQHLTLPYELTSR